MAAKSKTPLVLGITCGCLLLLCLAGGGVVTAVMFASKHERTPPATPSNDVPVPTLEPIGTPSAPEALPELPTEAGGLQVTPLTFTDEDGTDRHGKFAAGERIHYKFEIRGVAKDANDAWSVSMHLNVTAPNGESMLDETMVDQEGSMPEPLPLTGYVDLPPGSPAGTYQVRAVTKDKRSGAEVVENSSFAVE